jgi:hypothetical protein
LERLSKVAKRYLVWLDQFTGRMHQKHFPFDDPLIKVGEAARAETRKMVELLEGLRAGKEDRIIP